MAVYLQLRFKEHTIVVCADYVNVGILQTPNWKMAVIRGMSTLYLIFIFSVVQHMDFNFHENILSRHFFLIRLKSVKKIRNEMSEIDVLFFHNHCVIVNEINSRYSHLHFYNLHLYVSNFEYNLLLCIALNKTLKIDHYTKLLVNQVELTRKKLRVIEVKEIDLISYILEWFIVDPFVLPCINVKLTFFSIHSPILHLSTICLFILYHYIIFVFYIIQLLLLIMWLIHSISALY